MNPSAITPLPLPPDARAVLLYGGAFDPPHRAHTGLAALARDAAAPGAWLVFVPAARSPLKGPPGASDAHRLRMLELAIAGTPRAGTWTDELDRAAAVQGPSYWVDTLRRARAAAGDHREFSFLIGADQAADFHRWRDPREILSIARPLVLLRPPVASPDALRELLRAQSAWTPREIERWIDAVVPLPLDQTSATTIRAKLARDDAQIPELHENVLAYIRAHGLYRP